MFRRTFQFACRSAAMLLVVVLGAASPSQAAYPTGKAAQVMDWLPDDIESINCALGPLAVPELPRKGEENGARPPQLAGLSSQFFVSNLWLAVAERRLRGRTIDLSLEAKRKFKPPKELGLEKYEGCGVLLLQPQAGVTQEQTDKALQARSKKRFAIQGVAVALISSVETKNSYEKWGIYLAAPDPNTVLIATNVALLEHVITQVKANASRHDAPSSFKPMGPQWQGWAFVNTEARLWMARHDVSHTAVGQEPNDVVGYEDVENRNIVITGVLSNRVELFKVISDIRTETNLRILTKELQRGTYEIRCGLNGDDEELGTLCFYLASIFGPRIVVSPF